MPYKIVKKLPTVGRGSGRKLKYPFGDMKVGTSFKISIKDRMKVASAASIYGKRNDMKFSVRLDQEGELWCSRIN